MPRRSKKKNNSSPVLPEPITRPVMSNLQGKPRQTLSSNTNNYRNRTVQLQVQDVKANADPKVPTMVMGRINTSAKPKVSEVTKDHKAKAISKPSAPPDFVKLKTIEKKRFPTSSTSNQADIDVVDGNANNRVLPSGATNEVVGQDPSVGPNASCSSRLMDFLAEKKIDYLTIRKYCQQPIGDYHNSGLVWDSFRLPAELAGEELPPMPLTPLVELPSGSLFAGLESEGVSQQQEAKRLADKSKLQEIGRMNEIRQRMRADKLEETKRRSLLGIPQAFCEVDEEYLSDCDGSFSMVFTPSPTLVSSKKRIPGANADDNVTPSKRCRMTMEADGLGFQSTSTPISSASLNESLNLTPLRLSNERSFMGRRTRLFDEAEENVPVSFEECASDDTNWPDDDLLSQFDLVAVEMASANDTCSQKLASSLPSSTASQHANVSGEGFDDDSSEDLIFSQMPY